MKGLRIGIDFDNTIVCYDGVFHKAALEKRIIPEDTPTSKGAVRDYLRSIGKENLWTELQGYIYGAHMDLARPYPMVNHFFTLCQEREPPAFIISHKTRHPYLGPKYDLHEAAKNWLKNQPFAWVPPTYFELTLQEKLQRIKKQECTVFIDDLPEVLSEKNFPRNVHKILFDPNRLYSKEGDYSYTTSWEEIIKLLKHAT